MGNKLGKIEQHLFRQFIQDKCGYQRQEVSVGPQFGVDVSLVDLPGGMTMALTSDPLTLIPSLGLEESAWLSVHLMANDMATTGIAPMFGQFVLNLPAGFSKTDFTTYWEYIHTFCKQAGIAITGGHTGFIEGQNSTIAGGGTLIAIGEKNKMLVSTYAKTGDAILVTKCCALSSAAILAMSFPETVKNKVGNEIFVQACESFYQTSSLQDALTAVAGSNHSAVTAMHDVTEGGVLGAVYELAMASDNGAIIQNKNLPIGEVQAKVCEVFDLDPRYSIGAGAMIITCKQKQADNIIHSLLQQNIPCVQVGSLTSKESGLFLIEENSISPMPYFEEDPYWSAFYKAYSAGWK